MKINTASQTIGAQLVSATDGSAFTGAVTCYVTGNNGTQAAGSVGSGACTHKGNGLHTYAPAQAETNYAHIAFTFTGSGAVPATVQVYTTFPQTGDSFVRLPAALVSGRMDSSVGAMATGVLTAAAQATDAVDEIVDAVWDELLTGANHNIATSAGRRLRELAGNIVITGTAQGGGTASITLAASASSVDGTYDPGQVRIVSGTGAGQSRLILQYIGSTRVASVDRDWRTAPDSTSAYEIIATPNVTSTNEGLATAATSNTMTLNADASSIDDVYAGQTLVIRTGTGAGQTRMIQSYVGSTRTASVAIAWTVQPDTTTGYMIWPIGRAAVVAFGPGILDTVANHIWDYSLAGSPAPPVDSAGEALLDAAAGGGGGGGTDWTADERSAIKTILGIPASGTTPDDPSDGILDDIRDSVLAIKTGTDSLTFSVPGKVDANITHVNDVEVTGTGESGSEWGPA